MERGFPVFDFVIPFCNHFKPFSFSFSKLKDYVQNLKFLRSKCSIMHFIFLQRVTDIFFFPHPFFISTLFWMVNQTFLVNQILKNLFGGFEIVPIPIIRRALCYLLSFHILWEKWMHKRLWGCDSFVRVECEHTSQQIRELGANIREQAFPLLAGTFGKWFYIFYCIFIPNVLHILNRRSPKDRNNSLDLVQEILSRE